MSSKLALLFILFNAVLEPFSIPQANEWNPASFKYFIFSSSTWSAFKDPLNETLIPLDFIFSQNSFAHCSFLSCSKKLSSITLMYLTPIFWSCSNSSTILSTLLPLHFLPLDNLLKALTEQNKQFPMQPLAVKIFTVDFLSFAIFIVSLAGNGIISKSDIKSLFSVLTVFPSFSKTIPFISSIFLSEFSVK